MLSVLTKLDAAIDAAVARSEKPQLGLADRCEQMLSRACAVSAVPAEKIVYENFSPGDGHSQGDIRIQYLGDSLPSGIDLRQIAGLKINGLVAVDADNGVGDFESHKLVISPGMRVYALQTPHPLVGYFVYLSEGAKLLIEHPEHADVEFAEQGWYVTRFDRIEVGLQVRGELTVVRNVD